MTREEIIRRGYEAFEEAKKVSPEEGFRRMVERGIIDERGQVIWDGVKYPLPKPKKVPPPKQNSAVYDFWMKLVSMAKNENKV